MCCRFDDGLLIESLSFFHLFSCRFFSLSLFLSLPLCPSLLPVSLASLSLAPLFCPSLLPVSLARAFSIMRFLWWHVFIIVYEIFCEPSKFLLKCLHFIERWAHMILSDILSHHEQMYWYYMEMWRFSGKLYVFTMRKILKISRQTKKLRVFVMSIKYTPIKIVCKTHHQRVLPFIYCK